MRNESIAEKDKGASFVIRRSEQRFRITVGRFCCDGFTFRLAIGELLVVHVNRFQPRGQVVERGIGPDASAGVETLAAHLPFRSGVLAIATNRLIVCEAARLLVGVKLPAVLWRFALIAVVRSASVLRVERTAGKLCFAFGDCKLAFSLGGELLWGEAQDLGRAVFCLAHAECAAHFNGSRARVACKQHVADRGLQLLVRHGIGCSVGGRTGRARALSATVLFGFAPFRAVSVPVRATA
eukprot:4165007-Pleurochrysis_carterae.AAC.1